jgi:hypothetical protein
MTTGIRKYYDDLMGKANPGEAEKVMEEGIEAAVVGGILGAISAKRTGGLDAGSAPLDLAGGGLGMAAVMFAPLAPDMRERVRRVSALAIGIGTYRKVTNFGRNKGATPAGEFGVDEDPIVAAAKLL